MLIVWGLALFMSAGLRFWGFEHPGSFVVRPYLIWLLLFGPSLLLGFWLVLNSVQSKEE